MKILGIDTSTKFLTVGVGCADGRVAEFRLAFEKKQSVYILPTLKRITASLKIRFADFDFFAVGVGPGSFTGLRIGLSVIKGLVYCLKTPVIAISTLDILACNAKEYLSDCRIVQAKHICPVIDARRELVFAGLYSLRGGRIKKIKNDKLLGIDELSKTIPASTIFLGDGLKLYKEKLRAKVRGAIFLDEDYWYPQARNILDLARERIAARKFVPLSKLKPLYLYPKECQIKK